MTSIEDIPHKYEGIKTLFKRISKEDMPTIDVTGSEENPMLKITFQDQLQKRYGEALKETVQDQISTHEIWNNMIRQFLEQVDSSSSTSTINSIVHNSYKTLSPEDPIQTFAGFLLRLSIQLFQTQWFSILWELYHKDLNELEVQFLRFYRKRVPDVRSALKSFNDSDAATRDLNNRAIGRLFQPDNPHRVSLNAQGCPRADEFEIQRLKRTLMTKLAQSSEVLNSSEFCILLKSFDEYYRLNSIHLYDNTHPIKPGDLITRLLLERPHSLQWPLPSTIGLNDILQSHLESLDSKIKDMINTFFDNRHPTMSKYEGDDLPYPEELEKIIPIEQWAFYAVPGCGKTRSIEILLSRNWGFFLVAGSLPVMEGNTKRSLSSDVNIYDPRREGYSKDLHYLYMTINSYLQMFPDDSAWYANPHHSPRYMKSMWRSTYWKEILIYSRILVFGQFLSIAPLPPKPADWLEFQRCYDPFSPLFWLLTLQVNAFAYRGQTMSGGFLSSHLPKRYDIVRQTMQKQNVQQFFFVLDEAQHDLDAKFRLDETHPAIPERNHGMFTMIQLFEEMTLLLQFLLSQTRSIKVTRIYSGTSLRLKELTASLEEEPLFSRERYRVHSDFPLLRSNKDFGRLFEESKINAKSVLDPKQLKWIEKYSSRLRGRYLWSTLYIDKLKSLQSQGMTLEEEQIEKAADDVANRVKGDLKKRLERLSEQGPPSPKTQKLLGHLCWIAVNCELLDRPRTIALEEYEALVDQGFAIVSKERETEGSLEENLAMEAAVEWFQSNKPELIQSKMYEILQISALDHSNMGNAAEWLLAFDLYNLFRDRENRLLGSLRLQRREKVLKHLFKAKPMFKQPENQPPGNLDLDPKNYSLVIGKRIGYNFAGGSYITPSDDRTESSNRNPKSRPGRLELWEYLKSLRVPDSQPRPTFYFPDHFAGPDLVFAFEPITPKVDKVSERILCVVQLKTSGTSVDFQKAIKTTDLSLAHLSSTPENTKPAPSQPSLHRRAFSEPSKKYDSKQAIIPDGTKLKSNIMEKELQGLRKQHGGTQIAMPKNAKAKHDKMEEELGEWRGRTVIRILVCTQQESVPPEDVNAIKREQQERPRTLNDHFVMFGKAWSRDGVKHQGAGNHHSDDDDAHSGDLFGENSMKMLQRLKSNDTDAEKAEPATKEEMDAKKAERKARAESREATDQPEDMFDLFSKWSSVAK